MCVCVCVCLCVCVFYTEKSANNYMGYVFFYKILADYLNRYFTSTKK